MEKAVAMLATVGLSGVVGAISFGDTPLRTDLIAVITNVKVYPILSKTGPRYVARATIMVRNQGIVRTPACWLRSNISGAVSSNGVSAADTYLPVPAMEPGESASFVRDGIVGPGYYVTWAFVDSHHAVAEVNGNSNYSSQRFHSP